MTLAKRAIDQMGGTIAYESLPDKGTLVTIEVPLQIYPQTQDDNTVLFGLEPNTAYCALIGFDDNTQFGIHVAGEFLERKLYRRNVAICSVESANIVIIEEQALNDGVIKRLQDLVQQRAIDTIVLGSASSKRRWRSNPHWLDQECTVAVRWLFRPLNPVLMRQILHKDRSSVPSDFERRRSSTWTTYSSRTFSSRASVASALSNSDHTAASAAGGSTTSEDLASAEKAIMAVEGNNLPPVSIPKVTAEHLGNHLKFVRKCLPASDLKGERFAGPEAVVLKAYLPLSLIKSLLWKTML